MYSSPTIIKMEIKKDKMGREYITQGREEKCIQIYDGKARRKETTKKN
jgi:hypothetical protein